MSSNAFAAPAKLERVTKWSRFETSFRSSTFYQTPLDHRLRAELVSPIGETNLIECFWDGGRTWRLRFRPDLAGTWSFRTICSDAGNAGLHGREGSFLCTAAVSEQPFTRHGPVRRTPRGRTFQHRDGTPFLWVGDVSDSGIARAKPDDWALYSQIRARQRFTVVQWTLRNEADGKGELLFTDREGRIPNSDFFQRLDELIEVSSRSGLLNAIALSPEGFPSTDSAHALHRYAVARWSAYDVAWIIDPSSVTSNADFFAQNSISPALLRCSEVPASSPSWISGLAVRTDSPALLASNLHNLRLPIVLLLTNQENSVSPQTQLRVQASDIRREVWWNMLRYGAAGFTYSAAGVADWNTAVEREEKVAVWQKSLFLPGAKQIGIFSDLLATLPRERLRPAETVLEFSNQIGALQTERKDVGLFFSARGGMMELPLKSLPNLPVLAWFNPRTAATHPSVAAVGPETVKFSTPTDDDWLLIVRAKE